jgi:16S rRNA (cytosine967-C5)-methyltransferase
MTPSRNLRVQKARPTKSLMEISPARKAAFDILLELERGHSHSDDLLRSRAVDALSTLDRHLATALVLGVVRWQIRLDREFQVLLKRPDAKLDAQVLIALRLGALQILFMDRIPARAAIDESVELAKQAGHRFASGMVNAVLRKLARVPRAEFPQGSGPELALAEAHPAWMVERWAALFGMDATRAICRSGQTQPALALRIADAETELLEAGVVVEHGKLLTAARGVVSGDVTATDGIRRGRIRIQDEGSQLVAELAAVQLERGAQKILDACAAPGGKTLILAERNPQARIVALESSAARFRELEDRVHPFADRIECRLADARALGDEESADLVLADVPCSGTGTLGRNPEIRHRLRLEDLKPQAERQRAILAAALHVCRPGGRVVYSTCSLEPEENEQVVAAVLDQLPGVRQISLRASIDLLEDLSVLLPGIASRLQASLTAQGALRLLPGSFQTDGFFIALIEKQA